MYDEYDWEMFIPSHFDKVCNKIFDVLHKHCSDSDDQIQILKHCLEYAKVDKYYDE